MVVWINSYVAVVVWMYVLGTALKKIPVPARVLRAWKNIAFLFFVERHGYVCTFVGFHRNVGMFTLRFLVYRGVRICQL